MVWVSVLIAFMVAGLFTVMVAAAPKRASWAPLWMYLLILFFAAWAGGESWSPMGPAVLGVAWLPYFFLPLMLVLIILAVPVEVENSARQATGADLPTV